MKANPDFPSSKVERLSRVSAWQLFPRGVAILGDRCLLSALIALAVLLLPACKERQPGTETTQSQQAEQQTAAPAPVQAGVAAKTEGFPRYGDVMMRGLKVLRSADGSEHDTLAAAKAFGVNRLEWIYDVDDEFHREAREAGIRVSAAMSPNLYHQVLKGRPDEAELIQRFTTRDLAGNQNVMEHTKAWPGYEKHSYVPDMANEEFTRMYIDYVSGLVDKGFLTLHRDDGAPNVSMLRNGGSFAEPSIAYFRDYLKKKYSPAELAKLGVGDIETFNVREHFLALGAPEGNDFWKWRGSPLVDDYNQAMQEIVVRHWQKVRAGVKEKTGKDVVFSGHVLEWDDIGMQFDYGIAEVIDHFIQPLTIYDFALRNRQAGKLQAYLMVLDRKWETNPNYVERNRRAIALTYAFGMLPFVPWDQYMYSNVPRYFGKPEEYADLFWLVRNNRHLFDDHEEVFVTGRDSTGLYQWPPNQLLGSELAEPRPPVRLNSRSALASVRKVPGKDGSATVHLVDWSYGPRPVEVTVDPMATVGSESATITLLQPGKDPVPLGTNLGETLTLPALSPWALLHVEAGGSAPEGAIAAPAISGAPRGLGAKRTPIELIAAPGTEILYQSGGEAWVPYKGPITLDKPVTLTAKAVQPGSGKESAPVRASLQVFDDSRSTADLSGLRRVSLVPILREEKRGRAPLERINVDSRATVKGLPVSEGLRVTGNSRLNLDADPSWKVLRAEFGIDDAAKLRPVMKFLVFFDDKLAYESPIINPIKGEIKDRDRVRGTLQLEIPPGTKSISLATQNTGFFEDQSVGIWIEPSAFAE